MPRATAYAMPGVISRPPAASGPDTDVADALLQAEIDQARRKAAVDEQLAFLKKKMGKE